MPLYDLNDIKAAAENKRIEYSGRKVQRDIGNLDYVLEDVLDCLMKLDEKDFNKSGSYEDGNPGYDSYVTKYYKDGRANADIIFIKFRLIDRNVIIDLMSFHL